jgi:ABC-type bacteriocin/lantibiotic exporter with double-glycine peptidase domain
MPRTRWATAALALALSTGCYRGSARTISPAAIHADGGWLLVRGVPFLPQTGDEDCGAAALAMVLRYWNVATSPAEVAGAHPQSRGRGLRAGELRDFARGRGVDAFVVHGEPGDLRHELERGRPLIVGLAKPYTGRTLAHYEVLIGLHRDGRRVLTLDPAQGWRENTLEGFAAEWGAARQLLLVVFRRG